MTNERDFDRLARTWLDLGPNEAPDRVVAAVLQAAETTPQVRRPFLRPFWRSYRMTRLSIAAIAVVLVALIGGGIMLTRGGDQTVGGPAATPGQTTTPSATPSASTEGASVAPQIQGTWMGGTRSLPGVAAGAGTALQISPASLVIAQSAGTGQPGLSAQASSPSDGRLHVVTGSRDPAGCAVAVAGDYTWAFSPSGRILTITPISDPCAVRTSVLAGDWLQKACKDTSDNCLGDLDPGTYKSQFLTPHLKPGENWEPHYGSVTYTVPDGWANAGDWPADFNLVPSADYASYGPKGSPDGKYHEVSIWAHPAMTEQPPDCSGKPVTTIKQTVDGFVGWLREQPQFVVTKPAAITVGGRSGKWVDVQLAPDSKGTCPDLPAGTAAGQILARAGGPANETLGMTGGERMRFVFVDIGGGDVAAIFVDSSDPARFDQLASDAMPIIESMTFE